MSDKTFITCAITGNITRPDQTPHLPITPEHIANECLRPRARARPRSTSTCATRRPESPRTTWATIAK